MKKLLLNKNVIIRDERSFWLMFNPNNGATVKLNNDIGSHIKKTLDNDEKKLNIPNISERTIDVLNKEGFLIKDGCNKEVSLNNRVQIGERCNWVVGPQIEFSSKISPVGLLWEITNMCNLNCVYCLPNAKEKRKNNKELSANELNTIVDNIIRAKVCRVTISGGEALLRKDDMFQIARKLKSANIMVGAISNGLIIDEKMADEIKELGILMGVSLDAPKGNINCITRGKGVFEKALTAIRLLKKRKIPFNVISTVTNINFDYLPELFLLLRSIGVTNIGLQDLKPSNPDVYEKFKLTREQELKINDMYAYLKSTYPEICFNDNELRIFSGLVDKNGCEDKTIMRCLAGTVTGYINSEGDMFPCTSLKSLKMGNAVEDEITQMWQHSEAMKKLKKMKNQTTDVLSGCDQSCPIKKTCDGGCRGEAFYLNGDWSSLHPRCLKILRYENKI
ncbi:MAG: radical SAM protein [Pseudomonadota bacterium]